MYVSPVRASLWTGTLTIVATAALALVGAPRELVRWGLAAGLAAAWWGTVLWYFPPFVKRETVRDSVAFVPVGLAVLAAAAGAAGVEAVALRAAGAACLLAAAALLLAAMRNDAWRSGVPAWRRSGSYQSADRAAAALGAAALAVLVAAGVVLLAAPPRASTVAWVLTLTAELGAFAAFLLFLLPRAVKHPLTAMGGVVVAAATACTAAGAGALALAFALPTRMPSFAAASWLLAAGVAGLAVAVAVTLARVPRRLPGVLVTLAAPWLIGGVAALAVGAARLVWVFAGNAPLRDLSAAATAFGLGVAGAAAAVAVLAWPVLLNATPRGLVASRLGGAALGVAPVAGLASPALGRILALAAALAFAWQVAPMRRPRRAWSPHGLQSKTP